MKKKIIHEEEVQEGEIVESSWDVKKIAIGLVVLVFFIIIGSYFIKFGTDTLSNKSSDVMGASTQVQNKEVPPLPNKQDIQNAISDAKNTLSQITSENLTSSSAAIQKVIADLQTLQGKSGALGLVCKLMCKDK